MNSVLLFTSKIQNINKFLVTIYLNLHILATCLTFTILSTEHFKNSPKTQYLKSKVRSKVTIFNTILESIKLENKRRKIQLKDPDILQDVSFD